VSHAQFRLEGWVKRSRFAAAEGISLALPAGVTHRKTLGVIHPQKPAGAVSGVHKAEIVALYTGLLEGNPAAVGVVELPTDDHA